MSKTDFRDKKLPDEQGTIVTAEMMARLNNQVPTGEDFDGSSPALYGIDVGTANYYVVFLSFGKKATEGTNTNVAANKLVDSSATFVTSGVRVDDTVLNISEHSSAKVTDVDSETQLSLDADIFTGIGLYAIGPHVFQAPLEYAEGMEIAFRAGFTNTGPSTFRVNDLTPVPIKKQPDVDLAAGDIKAGQVVKVVYDGTNFQILGVSVGIDHGSLSGLDEDDHTQYYNSTRHTKAVHDALDIDAGSVNGKSCLSAGGELAALAGEQGTVNASQVVITSSPTDILTLDLGTLTDGDMFIIQGFYIGAKGATNGHNEIEITKYSGTASVDYCHDCNSILCTAYFTSTDTPSLNIFSIGTVDFGGTYVVRLSGRSVGSDTTVLTGEAQLRVIFQRKQ